jgi:hypothetical protein
VVKNVLSESGGIYFELNPEPWGYYTAELSEFFRRRGARVEGKKVSFRPGLFGVGQTGGDKSPE